MLSDEDADYAKHVKELHDKYQAIPGSHTAPNGKPYCNSADDVRYGHWIKVNKDQQKKRLFVCCQWNDHDYENVEECQQWNQAVNKGTLRNWHGSNEHLSQSGDHACTCDARNNNGNRYSNIVQSEQWEWIPDKDCVVMEWDPIHFCSLLGNRTILLIGDSTMQQTAATLMNMVSSDTVMSKYKNLNKSSDSIIGAQCAPQIFFGNSEFLAFEQEEMGLYFAKYIESHMNGKHPPHFVVLTHGAHTHEVFDFWTILSWLYKKIRTLQQFNPWRIKNIIPKFIWKTQNPGHYNCDDNVSLSGPNINGYNDYINKYNDNINSNEKEYQWKLFPCSDNVSRNMAKIYNTSIIDMSALYQRPDSHPGNNQQGRPPDCLHYCLPGPLNIFGQFMTLYLNQENSHPARTEKNSTGSSISSITITPQDYTLYNNQSPPVTSEQRIKDGEMQAWYNECETSWKLKHNKEVEEKEKEKK